MNSSKIILPTEQVVTSDTGLGTTYERWALNRYLLHLYQDKKIKSVLEGPGDGMTGITGINSLILAINGAVAELVLPNSDAAAFARQVWLHYLVENTVSWKITQADSLSEVENQFDLVWNFNVMTRRLDAVDLLKKMCRLSRRYVLIFVPNNQNYSFFMHRFQHVMSKEAWDHGRIDQMHPKAWHKVFNDLDMRVCETVWVDCPWWPDIIDPGQFFRDVFPFFNKLHKPIRSPNRIEWKAENLPYYDVDKFAAVHQHMASLAYFENCRFPWLKNKFAHHVGILAEIID